jgi:hypothetical protein
VVAHHILLNRGERKNVGDLVGLIEKKIALIFFKPLPPTLIPTNLVISTWFMILMWTCASNYIWSSNWAIPRCQMLIRAKVLKKANTGKIQLIRGQPPN